MVVRSPAGGTWTDAERWRVVADAPIAETPASDPLVFPAALETDAAGTLYVLDAASQRVHVFDAQGRHLRAFGRAGGGPGEFKQPMGMAVAPDGALWVVDPGSMRYTVFDESGAVVATHRRDGMAVAPWPGRFDRQGRLWDVAEGAGGPGTPPALVRQPAAGGAAERFQLPAFTPARWSLKNGSVQTQAFVPFSPSLVWALTPEGRVWSGISSEYRLALHEPGGDTLRVAELPVPPVSVTGAERDAAARELKWFTDQGGSVDLGQIPGRKPAFTSIHVDDQGYLWIRPALPEGTPGSAFDVVDPQGRYLGRVSLPVAIHERMPVHVRGDRLYTVVLSEDDVPRLVRFRVEGRG
ncbi:MAG: 6-bladed beta-propeller [Gemmatimonadetes bacterium]|nr:6-bladed beta-propeller [Gemmatimonadota bacterium]